MARSFFSLAKRLFVFLLFIAVSSVFAITTANAAVYVYSTGSGGYQTTYDSLSHNHHYNSGRFNHWFERDRTFNRNYRSDYRHRSSSKYYDRRDYRYRSNHRYQYHTRRNAYARSPWEYRYKYDRDYVRKHKHKRDLYRSHGHTFRSSYDHSRNYYY